MSSAPKCLQNRNLKTVVLPSGLTRVVTERIGPQHYLIWREGRAITEVRCVPTGSGRWYWRGSGLNWANTRLQAIINGRTGRIFRGEPKEPWSDEARNAIAETNKSHA